MGLTTRYPELSFITSVLEYKKKEVHWKRGDELGFEIAKSAHILYVYGFSPHLGPLLDWLNSDTSRDLVFIEDDLARIAKITEDDHGDIFKNERIHLRLILEDEPLESFAEDLVRDFPFENIAFAHLKDCNEQFEKLRLLLLRKSVVESAIASELLYYQRLFKNLKANFPLLTEASDVGKWKDAFKGMPAVICGAGPSLSSVKDQIEKMHGRGVVFAGGSAITALSSYHIQPDLLFAIDPNYEEFIRLALHTAFDAPLIYGNRLQPDVCQASVGDLAYVVSGTGGAIETWMEEELGIQDAGVLTGLSDEALSVTAVALKSAIYFGCSPIIFAGVDLSYGSGSRYTPGVVSQLQCALEESCEKASDTLMEKDGKITMAKWLMERDVINDVIEKNPDVEFIDGTGEGLSLKGAQVKRNWEGCSYPSCDIKGLIHDLCSRTKLQIPKEKIKEKIDDLKLSFNRCHEIITDILVELESLNREGEMREETAKESVLEMDLNDEIAYQVALQGAAYAWTFHIKKAWYKEQPKRKIFFIKSRLYRKLQTLVEEYQRI